MALLPGSEVGPTRTTGHPDPDDDVEGGDVAAIGADGNLAPADSESHDAHLGVVGRGIKAGNERTVTWHGRVVAAVEDAVDEGDALDIGDATGTTTGEFIADADGPVLALSDEGGTYRGDGGAGMDVPDGYAVVLLR